MSVQINRTTPQRAADVGRGLLALVGVALLVGGVPFALVTWVGSPLPAEMPSFSQITEALADTYIPDEFLIKALALVCWVVWVELAASLLVEAVAFARGRKAGAVPMAGGLQRGAARLIATVALLGAVMATRGSPEPSTVASGPLASPPQPMMSLVIDEGQPGQPGPPGTGIPDTAPETPAPVYEVRHRDTLWDIAERHLGDPFRWQEIFRINEGCPQADGGCLTDPDLIHPGWQLALPADAVGIAPPPVVAPAAPAPAHPGGEATTPEASPAEPGTTAPSTEAPTAGLPGGDLPGGDLPIDEAPPVDDGEAELPIDEAPPVDDGEGGAPASPGVGPSSTDGSVVIGGGMVLIDDGELREDGSGEHQLDDAVLVSDSAPAAASAPAPDGAKRPGPAGGSPGPDAVGAAASVTGFSPAPAPAPSPGPAPGQAPAIGQTPAPAPAEVTVQRGDNLWVMAEAQLAAAWGRPPTDAEIVGHWQSMIEENRTRLAPPGDPDLIHPGQVFVAPTPPADVTPVVAAAPTPTPADAEVRGSGDVQQPGGGSDAPAPGGVGEAPPEEIEETLPDIDEAPPVDGTGDGADEGAPTVEDGADPGDPAGESSADDGGPGGATGDGAPDESASDRNRAGEDDSGPRDGEQAASVPGAADGRSSGDESAGAATDDAGVDERAELPAGLVGGGLAVAGVLVLLERRRRAQQRHRRPGRVVPLPPPHLRDREEQLRWGADIDGARLLDAALRAAAAGAGATGLPPLRWAEARADAAVLVLAQPSPAPPGFVALDAARWVSGGGLDELTLAAAHAAAPSPTLTPVGTTEDGTELLVELESRGVTTVSGPADEAIGLLRAIVVAASTAMWSDQVQVVAVGLDPDLARLPGVDSVATLAEALDRAEAHATRTEAALRALRCPSIGQARAVGATPEAWDPLLVVAAVAPGDRSDQRRLEALSERPNSAVGLVTLPGIEPGPGVRSFAIGSHGWLEIEDVSEPVRPRYLGGDDVRALVDLLEGASRLADEAPDDSVIALAPRRPVPPPPSVPAADALRQDHAPSDPAFTPGPSSPDAPLSAGPVPPPDAAFPGGSGPGDAAFPPGPVAVPDPTGSAGPAGPAAAGRPDGAGAGQPAHAESPVGAPVGGPVLRVRDLLGEVEVLVRVLGEVEAVRLDRSGAALRETKLVPTRQRALETIAYLALRESAVDREDLEISLFPHGANAAKTVYNTVSSARSLVGDALFPPPGSGRYELSPAVVTDYGLFCEMVATADEIEDAETAADVLSEALSLVRGEPFTGVGRGYAWVGPHRGMIVAQVVDAAEELAEVRLAMGDWRSAEWAARQGLRAFPSDERMYRLLMRTARAAGNIPGVQRVFRELCDVLADPDLGVEPEDTVHPETIDLLEELTGTMPRHGRMGA